MALKNVAAQVGHNPVRVIIRGRVTTWSKLPEEAGTHLIMPNTEVRFVGKEVGSLVTEGGVLFLGVTHTLAETPSPDLVLVPGGTTTPGQMVDDETLDWLRKAHETTTWTTSVCTGSLILAAAGILKGLPATTHSIKMGVLRTNGLQA